MVKGGGMNGADMGKYLRAVRFVLRLQVDVVPLQKDYKLPIGHHLPRHVLGIPLGTAVDQPRFLEVAQRQLCGNLGYSCPALQRNEFRR